MGDSIIIEARFQGVSGRGQGGHAAGLLTERIPGRATVDFTSPIPLGRALTIEPAGSGWRLVDGERTILRVRPTDQAIRVPEAAGIDEAISAAARSPVHEHPVLPDCFSCGTRSDSMNVHAGPLPGRAEFATPWMPPPWTGTKSGMVLDRFVWAAIDCPAGWHAGTSGGGFRAAVTGVMRAEIERPVEVGRTYAIVAWSDPWQGRIVTAGASMFDEDGRLVASSESMWIDG